MSILHRYLPGIAVRTVAPMGEGLDNVAWLVNGDLVVRRARDPDPEAIRREVAVLETVGRYATLAVPRVVVADPDEGVLVYRILPGQSLIDTPPASTCGIAGQLGHFLGAIHSIPLGEVEGIVPLGAEPLQEWLDEARDSYPDVAGHIPARLRGPVEAFLGAPPPPDPERLAFCHNDLGAEHILVDSGTMRITGIIDWTDAAIADPVRDLALILRDLGPYALDSARVAYGAPITPADHERLVFHARCKLLEDVAFGLDAGGTRYLDAALAHLDWTFGQA